jgi:glycosyltransferase involved in cell wall biosynthesis
MHAHASGNRGARTIRDRAPVRDGGTKRASDAAAARLAQAAMIDPAPIDPVRVGSHNKASSDRAGFMNDAMWFAWLLRPDVRQGAAINNLAAQREFVVWWLLDGPAVFPGGWSVEPACAAVAMEAVQISPGFRLPRLLRGLYRRRADLRAAYPLHDLENLYELLAWYRVHGEAEMKLAPKLPQPFHDLTEAPSLRPPWANNVANNATLDATGDATGDAISVPRTAVRLHGDSAALQVEFDPLTPEGKRGLASWYRSRRAAPAVSAPPRSPKARRAGTSLPPASSSRRGVNLIGYPRGEFGIGEDIRMLARALDEARIPFALHDLQSGTSARQADSSLADRITTDCPYPIDILCQTAFDTARCFLQGRLPSQNTTRGPRYTIGYWPWELQRFPACWHDVHGLVDEVWAASRFTYDAYMADWPGRVHLMPPAVCLDPAVAPCPGRDAAGAGAYIFLCPFDPNSFAARKNPAGALRAFQAAFPRGDDSVRLVLRSNGSLDGRIEFAALRKAALSDRRCILEEDTSSRADYQRRIGAADCLVSPHRAEGFGRNIAEAILLGVQVLATGASGCTDFLQADEALNWTPRLVCGGEYPFADGMFWAEPDFDDLVERMRLVRRSAGPPAERREALRLTHGAQAAGERVACRLAEILESKVLF